MGENQKRILEMLAAGKISVEEANRLLSLVNEQAGKEIPETGKKEKTVVRYLVVRIEPKPGMEAMDSPRVNVRVPVSLLRAGVKMKNFIPPQAADEIDKNFKQSGIGFNIRHLKDEDIEPLLDALSDTEINVETNESNIRVNAE